MRTFAVGDIHGCLDHLHDLLEQIQPRRDDMLIFLGDAIDRGPHSKEVVDELIRLSQKTPCIFLRGNHEDMFLEYLATGARKALYLTNGGLETVLSYAGDPEIPSKELVQAVPPQHWRFYEQLRWYHEDERYIYVHAGIRPGVAWQQQERADLLWIRDEFLAQPTGLDKTVIFGHTPFAKPYIRPDKIGIDTGAVYDGTLSAIELPTQSFLHSYGPRT